MKKITIQKIQEFKHSQDTFATLTAYDFNTGQILDDAGIPLILVGDSASMTVYGYDTTVPISMSEMLLVVRSVCRGVSNALVVADMPFLSYQPSVEETIKNLGQVDIAVGNAAINPHYGSSMKIPDEIFSKVMQTNIQSNLWLAQLVSPGMKERKDGSIIYISSIGGLRGSDVIGTYGISKAADMQLTRNLAIELGPSNIRVNCIAPGLVKTDFARALWENPKHAKKRLAETPLRRLGEPRDIAGMAIYLASEAGTWTTGQTFVVDGGTTAMGLG